MTSAPLRILLAGNFLSSRDRARGPIEDLADRLERTGYRCIRGSSVRTGVLRAAHLIGTALLKRQEYDVAVVDLYSGRAFLWGEALSRVLRWIGRPFCISMHGGGLPEFALQHKRRVMQCLARATVVTAPSRYLIEQMQPYRPDITLLPNALAVSDYPFRLRAKPTARLVWVRGFHKIYNPVLAVTVVSRLRLRGIDASLTMVGSDRGDGALQQTIAEVERLGLAEHVTFAGSVPRSQVPKYLEDADIFLNTTNVDNTPVSVLEAMACGLCVVTTRVGGIPYLLRNGEDSLLVSPEDAEAMTSAILMVLQSPGLAERISARGRAKATELDWPVILPQWETLLADTAIRRASEQNVQTESTTV